MKTVRVAAAQTVEYREDIDAALSCLSEVAAKAKSEGAALVCFPEGFLQGYLTDETVARRNAFDLASRQFEAILEHFPKSGPMIVVGLIEIAEGRLFNTAIVVNCGVLIGRYRKSHLLGGEQFFGIETERRIYEIDGLKFGINICNDTNFPEAARSVAELGASLIVCPANNLLCRDAAERFKDVHNAVRGERCQETGLWLISSDVTGERDGRLAWGPTAVLSPTGQVVASLPLGKTGLLIYDVPCP